MRRLYSVFLSLAVMACVSCGSSDSDSGFKDKLTIGTGIAGTGFTLVGESTTFSLAMQPPAGWWFRLESAADMKGRAVRIFINDGTYGQKDYANPQSYGHIFLSQFRITDVGTFTIKGVLVEQVGPDIGKETLVASTTITMTP